MTIAQTLLPEYDHEMAGCRKELERIPDGRFDYKPHVKSSSLGQLANHLATIPGWLATTLRDTEMDFSDPKVKAAMPAPVGTRDALLALFDGAAAKGRETLAATPDGEFAVTWTGKSNGKVVLALPRIAVYRSFIMNHLIHHRAQLGVYLRLLDQPVPSIYGPSADESGM
jgi:uncharacterized damage-inducible protein DinB